MTECGCSEYGPCRFHGQPFPPDATIGDMIAGGRHYCDNCDSYGTFRPALSRYLCDECAAEAAGPFSMVDHDTPIVDRTPSLNLTLMLGYIATYGDPIGTVTLTVNLDRLYNDRDWSAALAEGEAGGFLTLRRSSFGTARVTLTATGLLAAEVWS